MPKQRKSRGGGFSTGPDMVSPGNAIYHQYEGSGMDCAGTPMRPGFIDSYSGKGLPGLSGGRRKRHTRHGKRRTHGGTQLQTAFIGDMTGLSAPGVPPHPVPQAAGQKGGRYEVNPGPIVAGSAIGMSGPSPFQRIACETGTYNELNGSREVQVATTAIPIKGGKRRSKRRNSKRRYSGGAALGYAPVSALPTVSVGDAGSKAYYAPTAGYRNDFEALPAGGAVPGLTLQIPYDARAGNPACGMSGGRRKSKRHARHSRHHVHFGGNSLTEFEKWAPLTADKLMNRSDFDGTTGGLPVKYGGKRSTNKRSSKRRKRSCFSLKKLFRL